MTFLKINIHVDLPTEDAKLLGHDEMVETLCKFLLSPYVIGPLSIALHGDWGSGKTSLLKTTKKELKRKNQEIIFFEAWKHEYSNPTLALVATIVQKYEANSSNARALIYTAANILSHKFLNMDLKAITDSARKSSIDAESFHTSLETIINKKLKNKKLFIFIDDLDRCDVENTLMILAFIKLFLDIKNCICIAAVDLNRLATAWAFKYGKDPALIKEGIVYLEKIFQIRIGIPQPSSTQLRDYLKQLVPNISDDFLKLLSEVGPSNPRNIKRMLNLAIFRSFVLGSDDKAEVIALLGTIFEQILSNKGASQFAKSCGNSRNFIDLIIHQGNKWDNIKGRFKFNQSFISDYNPNVMSQSKLFFEYAQKILKSLGTSEAELEPYFDKLIRSSNEENRLS